MYFFFRINLLFSICIITSLLIIIFICEYTEMKKKQVESLRGIIKRKHHEHKPISKE